jgi:putative transport protein
VVGVVLFVTLIPKLFHVDLTKEEQKYQDKLLEDYPQIVTCDFLIERNEVIGTPFHELKHEETTKHCITTKIFRDQEVFIPHTDTLLKLNDIIRVVGPAADMEKVATLVGRLTKHDFPETTGHDAQWIFVTNKSVINKRIGSLNLFVNFNASIAILKRSGIDIAPDDQTQLRFGDRILVAADKEAFSSIITLFGNDSKRLSETDFLPITLGIIIGILLGSITIPMGFFNFKLGLTGGVLTAALVLSGIGKTGPIIWSMSSNANLLIREFGLLLFLSAVGCEAGAHLVETLTNYGVILFVIGIVATLFPMIVGWWLGKLFFKIDLLSLLGLITGGMTSTPGLGAAAKHTETNIPQVAYATVYPFALVLMIIFSKLLSLL